MNFKYVMEYIKEKGILHTLKTILRIVRGKSGGKVYNILLLTNRDSDNVGDQVIEACDIGLLETIMKNMMVKGDRYQVTSRAASIISQKYLATKDPALLKNAKKLIKNADVVVFGGAPMFNYLYQNFYERTAVTLELAQQYHVPVIFSAIGVEGYHEDDAKCQRLKKTLNFDCVKQITTRDGYDSLMKYKENENMLIDKVADPAVFTGKILEDFRATKKNRKKKKIGIFVLRANGFTDNKIDFPRDKAAQLWIDLAKRLEEKGYDYELLSSGHFGDEAFLDRLIKLHNVDAKKCVFNMNSPEQLIQKISSYDAVVSTRLHPSIISFSLDVPSVGVVWNMKVPGFYESIGYGDRVIDIREISVDKVVQKLEKAMEEGVQKDPGYLMTVYQSLYSGIKQALFPNSIKPEPYSYEQLMRKMSKFKGTSEKEMNLKIQRKLRRTYGKYNELFEKKANMQN